MTIANTSTVVSTEEAGTGCEPTASARILCGSCSKSFESQQAVEGHVRRDHAKLMCGICEKSFGSRNSLNGHMRMHPDQREYRGIKDPKEKINSYYSCNVQALDQRPELTKSSPPPSKWAITGKRGRKSVSSRITTIIKTTITEKVDYNDKELVQAAENLIWLSRSNQRLRQQFLSPEIHSSKELVDDHEALPNFNQLEQSGKRKLIMGPDDGRHQCKICNKCFSSGQALGGHMSAHIPRKPSNSSSQTSSLSENTTPSQTGRKVLPFDLNELPPIDEDQVPVPNHYSLSACSYNNNI